MRQKSSARRMIKIKHIKNLPFVGEWTKNLHGEGEDLRGAREDLAAKILGETADILTVECLADCMVDGVDFTVDK